VIAANRIEYNFDRKVSESFKKMRRLFWESLSIFIKVLSILLINSNLKLFPNTPVIPQFRNTKA